MAGQGLWGHCPQRKAGGVGKDRGRCKGEGRRNGRRAGTKAISSTASIRDKSLDELCQGAEGSAKGERRGPLPLAIAP